MSDILLISGKLNNRQDEARLGKLSEDSPTLSTLVEAKNFDIDANGATYLRDGRVLKLAIGAHSLWVDPRDDKIAYFVALSVLYKLETDFTYNSVATMACDNKMAYEPVNGETVISNGKDIGWLTGKTYDAFNPTLGQFEVPTSSGQYLCFFRGVLYVADSSVLKASKPHNIEVMDERYCFFPMAGHIRMLGNVDDGMFVATEKGVIYLPGTFVDEFKVIDVSDSPPPDGCFMRIKKETKDKIVDEVVWASEEGFCIGSDGGQYENKSAPSVALPKAEYGLMLERFNNGIRQYIAVMHQPDNIRKYTGPDISVNVVNI